MKNSYIIAIALGFTIIIGIILYLGITNNSKKTAKLPEELVTTTSEKIKMELDKQAKTTEVVKEAPIMKLDNSTNTNTTKTAESKIDPAKLSETVKVNLKTSSGDISINLYTKKAPKTVANFVEKAMSSYYSGLTFHRVEDWVLQGGDPRGNGTGGGNIPTELSDGKFTRGALGVARGMDIKVSNDSQFFFTKKDSQFLDGQYTYFGEVTEGMDVVDDMEIGDKILEIKVESGI